MLPTTGPILGQEGPTVPRSPPLEEDDAQSSPLLSLPVHRRVRHHWSGAIRRLRWSDIDFEHGRINWRAESEKSGYAHSTPMTQAVRSMDRPAVRSLQQDTGSGSGRTQGCPRTRRCSSYPDCAGAHLVRDNADIGDPHVSLVVHREAVRSAKHSDAEACQELA